MSKFVDEFFKILVILFVIAIVVSGIIGWALIQTLIWFFHYAAMYFNMG